MKMLAHRIIRCKLYAHLPAHSCIIIAALLLVIASQSPALVVTSPYDYGPGSLPQAIADAASGDTITFTNTLSGQSIQLCPGRC